MKKLLLPLLMGGLSVGISAQNISASLLGRYTDGRDAACEISAYDATSKKLFITNAAANVIDIIDITNPASPDSLTNIDVTTYGGGVNSLVNLGNGYFAAAIEAVVKQDSGKVVFFDTDGNYVSMVTAGALPDMVTVTKDGSKVLVANEGEPNANYDVDPEGSITIIDISAGVASLTAANVTHLDLKNAPAKIDGALFKPGATKAQDLEPEYIAVNDASTLAAVTCQENNVLILVDLTTNTIVSYKGLGFKDHSIPGNGFDASNKDDAINITTHNVKGVYQPDAISSYTSNGTTYFLTANEGDGREYEGTPGYISETRIKDLSLDPTAFPDAASIQASDALGRLKTFTADMIGDTDGDGDVDELYSYGARSFSIWDASGNLVWDSGDDFEQYIAANYPDFFNCDDGLAAEKDERSDDKGAEPEAITVGKIGSKAYAFIGLERQGGIMVYNITDPTAPVFDTYINTISGSSMIDIAPEGILFVPAAKSHTGTNLLIVSNEVSGTTVIYEITDITASLAESSANALVKVYPNPCSSVVNVEVPETCTCTITNPQGVTVFSEIVEGSKQISLDAMPKGAYVLSVDKADVPSQVLIKE